MADTNPIDAVHLIRSYMLHCRFVRHGLNSVVRELSERAERHDDSKLMADEFDGFTRINKAARENAYLSPEYKAGLAHPEFHGDLCEGRVCVGVEVAAEKMTWLDIVEMVCDWHGAYRAYGSKGTWEENMERQRERYKVNNWFTKEQWWLIDQVAIFIGKEAAR